MDTLSLAEQFLNKQYNNVKYMFCISDNRHEAQFFKADDKVGNPVIKMLVFTNRLQETTMYDIKPEKTFSLSQ
ncbi:MAG: hypothetical protein JST75_09615 [Bacteroidetes bacterium]|nr:hypothetical protein [Bacteroidota bacterium]